MARSPKAREKATSDPAHRDASIPSTLQILFGERLRQARIAAGLTQPQVGERCGMTAQYVSRVELGRKNLTLITMAKLAEAVGSRVSDMLREPEVSQK